MYEVIMWDAIALCAVCALLGLIGGLYLSRWAIRRKQQVMEAPAPDYDPCNPMNAGRGRETVEICGAKWYVMNSECRIQNAE